MIDEAVISVSAVSTPEKMWSRRKALSIRKPSTATALCMAALVGISKLAPSRVNATVSSSPTSVAFALIAARKDEDASKPMVASATSRIDCAVMVGFVVGTEVVGDRDGDADGDIEGATDGDRLGLADGDMLGNAVGATLGDREGAVVGEPDGDADGE